jgi:AcrR family transcriptional regulator
MLLVSTSGYSLMLAPSTFLCNTRCMAAGKPYHHGNLRVALLDASLALVRKDGLHGFTLREVARRAGVSHTAPYRHFRDKDDLLAAIAEDGFKRFTAKIREAASKGHNPLGRLQMAGVAYVQFGLDRPEEFQVMFSVELDPDIHPSARAAADASFESLLALVVDCQRAGLLPRNEPHTAARIAWAHVHGITELARRRQFGFKTRKEIVDFTSIATAALLTGIAEPS